MTIKDVDVIRTAEPLVRDALQAYESRELAERIEAFLPVVARANRAFGKSNSQTSSSLMSLNMIDGGPYRVLRQILAQIENKRLALKEAGYRITKAKIRLREISDRLEAIGVSTRPEIDTERSRLQLKEEKILSDMKDSKIYIDATVKELGAFMERYKQVLEAHGIREDWDEKDFEEAEIRHHITCMFRLGLRDRLGGSVNMGTMEYFEQFGIEPMLAYHKCDELLGKVRDCMRSGAGVTIQKRYQFYDDMYELFKDEYKRAMLHIGLGSVTFDEWLIKND